MFRRSLALLSSAALGALVTSDALAACEVGGVPVCVQVGDVFTCDLEIVVDGGISAPVELRNSGAGYRVGHFADWSCESGSDVAEIVIFGTPGRDEILAIDLAAFPSLTVRAYLDAGDDSVRLSSGFGASSYVHYDLTLGPGDDYAELGPGDDTVYGEEGADILRGEGGADALYGGGGEDRIYGGDGADRIDGGADADALYGGDDNDVVYGGSGPDDVHGGAGDDRLYGGKHDDVLDGGPGDDFLSGGLGEDVLFGGTGNDTLAPPPTTTRPAPRGSTGARVEDSVSARATP